MNSFNQITNFPTLPIEIIQILGNQNNNGGITKNQIQIFANQNNQNNHINNECNHQCNDNCNDNTGYYGMVGYGYNVIETVQQAESMDLMGCCTYETCKRHCQGFVLANKRKTCNCGHSLAAHFIDANGDRSKIQMQHQFIDSFSPVPVPKTKKPTKVCKTKTIGASKNAVRTLVSKLNKNGSSSPSSSV